MLDPSIPKDLRQTKIVSGLIKRCGRFTGIQGWPLAIICLCPTPERAKDHGPLEFNFSCLRFVIERGSFHKSRRSHPYYQHNGKSSQVQDRN